MDFQPYQSMSMCKVSTTVHFVPRVTDDGESNNWVPNTDVYVTDEGLVVKVELAGMTSDQLQISVDGNKLRISGQREDCCRAAKFNFLAMEINYGAFENVLDLPPGYDLNLAKASYLNGFLRIDVPQAVAAPSKRTRVQITDK